MISDTPEVVRDNFRFLLVETMAQVSQLRAALDQGSLDLARKVLDRIGYADNLKMRIRDGCMDAIRGGGGADDALTLRAVESMAVDLERITLLCHDCVRQYETLGGGKRRRRSRHANLLNRVERALQCVSQATSTRDSEPAVRISHIRGKIDRDYKRLLDACNSDLKRRKNPAPVLVSIFMAQRIEEMGTALQSMGDAVISANLGHQLNADRYRSLSATVAHLQGGRKKRSLAVKPLAQTRSGGAISGISRKKDNRKIAVIKDGKRRKLKEERDKVDTWNAIYPGLAPKILSYYKHQDSAALLIEHLPGQTFEQILLNGRPALLDAALKSLKKTLRKVWIRTHVRKPVPARFMAQLADRMDAVYDIHPEFRAEKVTIAGIDLPSFDQLVSACGKRESALNQPYTVRIHGDFNIDNIIYDSDTDAIRFIDLHRSTDMDFAQDVSVFMVSNYRLQALDAEHRRRAHVVAALFYRFARQFAKSVGDDSFDIRLALGLARSFATSTRFVLDPAMALGMQVRARFLLERVLAAEGKSPSRPRLPIEELFID